MESEARREKERGERWARLLVSWLLLVP